MRRDVTVPISSGRVKVVFTTRADGDFRPYPDVQRADRLRRQIIDRPTTWLRQVHGSRVVTVTEPGELAGVEADGAVTTTRRAPLAVSTADCAPVVLVAERGVAVVHAGWRGLVAGVVANGASQLRAVGGEPVASFVGACISPQVYEFGLADLDRASEALGVDVKATTEHGMPALDVPRAVAAACTKAGWPPPIDAPPCTSGEEWFSHRTRRDDGRQVTMAWLDP